jgi:hypothetical protein
MVSQRRTNCLRAQVTDFTPTRYLPKALREESHLQGHKERQSQLKALVRDDVPLATQKILKKNVDTSPVSSERFFVKIEVPTVKYTEIGSCRKKNILRVSLCVGASATSVE